MVNDTTSSAKKISRKRKSTEAKVDEEALIELIRAYPCIWNCKLASNKEFDKRKNAWEAIQKSLDNGKHSCKFMIFSNFMHMYSIYQQKSLIKLNIFLCIYFT